MAQQTSFPKMEAEAFDHQTPAPEKKEGMGGTG